MSPLIEAPDDIDAFNEWALAEGWGDGLPLIPPTPERVGRLLQSSWFDPDSVIAWLPPNEAGATVGAIAVNAVMAGCEPAHLPLLVTAIEALSDPTVDLKVLQATTHPGAVMLLVNGPIARHAGIHGGVGVFGPGFRANAVIGRALRLVLMNIAGARAGSTDISTQGTPAKYSFCFAENEAESPWPPYHVDLGFTQGESTVTVFGCEGPHNLNDHVSRDPAGLMLTFSQTMAGMGSNNAYIPEAQCFLVLGLEHARLLAEHGWQRKDVQQYLFARTRIPYRMWRRGGMAYIPQPRYLEAADDDFGVPITASPEGFRVVVAGGLGRHSSWIPGFRNPPVTRVIMGGDGRPWQPTTA